MLLLSLQPVKMKLILLQWLCTRCAKAAPCPRACICHTTWNKRVGVGRMGGGQGRRIAVLWWGCRCVSAACLCSFCSFGMDEPQSPACRVCLQDWCHTDCQLNKIAIHKECAKSWNGLCLLSVCGELWADAQSQSRGSSLNAFNCCHQFLIQICYLQAKRIKLIMLSWKYEKRDKSQPRQAETASGNNWMHFVIFCFSAASESVLYLLRKDVIFPGRGFFT